MDAKSFVSEQNAAGWLLVFSGLVFSVGGILYTGRAIWKWPAAGTSVYLRWERGFVIAALLIAVIGLILLERMLEAVGDRILAPSGMAIFLIGAVLVIVAETLFLNRQEWIYPLIVAFVVLAFLGQAVFGAALLRTGLLPRWVGWIWLDFRGGWSPVCPDGPGGCGVRLCNTCISDP